MLAPEPEKIARESIDKLLTQAGWFICNVTQADIHLTIVRNFLNTLFAMIFPVREWVPKTLSFAKDDADAENPVQECMNAASAAFVEIEREEFGKSNNFL